MKRSEVLQKLSYMFDQYEYPWHLAKIALETVENLGMLPPYTKEYEENCIGDKVSYNVNKWEDE